MRLNFHFGIHKLGNRMRFEGIHDFAERLLDRMRFIADHRHADDDRLTVIVSLDLGDRHVERLPQAVFDAIAAPGVCLSGCVLHEEAGVFAGCR